MKRSVFTRLLIAVVVASHSRLDAISQQTVTSACCAATNPTLTQDDNSYYDIGGFHCKVSTDSPSAQLWFDRGLAMCFGFNHEEAVRCFERAYKEDPLMAMALWGMAYAWGPNINNLEIEPQQMAQAAACVRLAELQISKTTNREQELITALAHRYAVPVPEDRRLLNAAYANAMRDVYQHSVQQHLT